MSHVAATLYEGSRVDRSRYGYVDHRERQSRCALRSDDTGAPSGGVGSWRGPFRAFSMSPPPNRACNFRRTRLSSDHG